MFDSFFPNWSNPSAIAFIVGLRVALNVALIAIVASAVGNRSALTVGAFVLTLLSAAITILVLRPGVLGLRASYVELLVQGTVLLLGTYAVYSNPSSTRIFVFAPVSVGAFWLVGIMIPIYGEAFVAP